MQAVGVRCRWRFDRVVDVSGLGCSTLAAQAKLPPLVAALLEKRGFTDPASAHTFLEPRLGHLHDPRLLPGAARAAGRLAQAVRDGQPIVVYGDYDVDGVTASAILWHVLRLAGARVDIYVPHRVEEGYGLNSRAIEQLAQGRPVIVSVDCGITACGPARAAKEAGVDLIITDHHEFDEAGLGLPDAHTLVHPRLPGSAYPFGQLCGAAVAFKVAWEFARQHCGSDRLPDPFRDLLLDLLSYVALGTVADVVPLVDESRVMAVYGLGQIKRTGFVGLNALIDASNLREEKIGAYHVGFVLGPRLNACGRMGHAQEAVRLLTTGDPGEAAKIAAFLTRENERRRSVERGIFEQAMRMVVENGYDQPDQRAIVLGHEDWHPGVIGIVASRLVEAFARPVVMLHYPTNSEDEAEVTAQGSARSVAGVSIYDAIAHCQEMLSSFGGHAMAAGLKVPVSRVDQFRRRLVGWVNDRLAPEDLVGTLEIDTVCRLGDLSLGLFEQIDRLAPFGRANPSPVLCVRGVINDQPARRIGAGGKHLRLMLRQDRRLMSAVGFGMGDLAERLPVGTEIDVVFEPKVSTWQGRRQAEIHVKDLRVASAS